MTFERCSIEEFTVFGKEGSTDDGEGFIGRLWEDANAHFSEVEAFAVRDKEGRVSGIWGLMSDMSHSFKPWENNFSKGLYLAGVEVQNDAVLPCGWVKWVAPASEYIRAESSGPESFSKGLEYIKNNGLELVGAAYDFICPVTQKNYTFYPVRRI